MDERERKRLEDEINRGVPNTGIYKVDGDALERENRSPLVIGGGIGLGFSGPLGVGYIRANTADDSVLTALGIIVAGAVIGAALGWLVSEVRKPPQGTP